MVAEVRKRRFRQVPSTVPLGPRGAATLVAPAPDPASPAAVRDVPPNPRRPTAVNGNFVEDATGGRRPGEGAQAAGVASPVRFRRRTASRCRV